MAPYNYLPLTHTNQSIRLLRLMPHQDQHADIQCELFEYSLQGSDDDHLYEALSYVWGNPNVTLPISITEYRMDVTVNLHAALLRLRNRLFDRVLWIDAICINQNDQNEKISQIQFMVHIYSKALRVVAWLGEAADNSHLAFQDICADGADEFRSVPYSNEIEAAGLALLQRPWFRRIWVCCQGHGIS